MKPVLLDTGPLVALASARDAFHLACVEQLALVRSPLITTWAVLTEAAYILRDEDLSLPRLFELGEEGMYVVADLPGSCLPWLRRYLLRYRSIKAQLADATFVYLAEFQGLATIFTLDRRDFSIYRFGRNKAFRLLPEQ